MLKSAILRRENDCVGGVGSVGMRGVGKVVVCDADVIRSLSSGVYYLTHRNEANAETVVLNLAAINESSGGDILALMRQLT
jgi:hypothetical protein